MLHCIYLVFFVYLIFLHDYYQVDAGEGKITTFKWDKEDLKSQKRTTKSQGAPNLWKKCHGISGYVRHDCQDCFGALSNRWCCHCAIEQMLIQWGSSVGTENFSPVNEAKRQLDAETTGRAEKT